MLSVRHKAQILIKAGIAMPPCPTPAQHGEPARPGKTTGDRQLQAGAEGSDPEAAWRRQIENLYVQYAAQRAAKRLRDAAEAQQLARLRQANDR